MFFCTLLTSTAQFFLKRGANILELNLIALITNYYLIMGLAIYLVGAILMIAAFRGGEVSVLYPIIATSYIWVSLFSIFLLRELMNVIKWTGVFVIIMGIFFVGLGSKKQELELTRVT